MIKNKNLMTKRYYKRADGSRFIDGENMEKWMEGKTLIFNGSYETSDGDVVKKVFLEKDGSVYLVIQERDKISDIRDTIKKAHHEYFYGELYGKVTCLETLLKKTTVEYNFRKAEIDLANATGKYVEWQEKDEVRALSKIITGINKWLEEDKEDLYELNKAALTELYIEIHNKKYVYSSPDNKKSWTKETFIMEILKLSLLKDHDSQ